MNLEDFVQQTLLDITNGVNSAQKKSPLWIAPGRVEGEKVISPQIVSFEVIVTTTHEGGGKIKVWSAAEAGGNIAAENTNKIAFGVPIYFQAPRSNQD